MIAPPIEVSQDGNDEYPFNYNFGMDPDYPTFKLLDSDLFDRLQTESLKSVRQRTNCNLHAGPADLTQRFLNVMQPGTYVRPHRHTEKCKWELITVITGKLLLLTLSDIGQVLQRIEVSAAGPIYGIELSPSVWHTTVALEPGTVLLEIKPGPYNSAKDKEFAAWAPPEGAPACQSMQAKMKAAKIGDYLAN